MKRRDFLKIQAAAGLAAGLPAGYHLLKSNGYIRTPKAKSVVVLFMTGGPSQIELFDYKPELHKFNGKTLTSLADQGFAAAKTESAQKVIMEPISNFKRHGQCGQWVSDLFPNIAKLVDDMTIINTLTMENSNHAQAQLEYHTGVTFAGQPYMGAWLEYAMNKKQGALPKSFIMTDTLGKARIGDLGWSSGNLPNANSKIVFAGVDAARELIKSISTNEKEASKLFMKQFESLHRDKNGEFSMRDKERIDNYHLIYSMREAVMDALDMSNLTFDEIENYGVNDPVSHDFAKQLIVARRLVEKEVPFIEIYCGSDASEKVCWDHHKDKYDTGPMAYKVDRPVYAFINDLKQRGLLDETLVIWGGEMGRGPSNDPNDDGSVGRPHNKDVGTVLLFGAGVKKGFSYGETDDLSYQSVKNPVHVGDLWATVFHLMGIDHQSLQYKDLDKKAMRITKSTSCVLHDILA